MSTKNNIILGTAERVKLLRVLAALSEELGFWLM